MNHSYVMGVNNSIVELQKYGFIIENDGDNFMVSFPKEKSKIWKNFISNHLELIYTGWSDCLFILFKRRYKKI